MVEANESEIRRESEQREKGFTVTAETEEQAWNKLQHDTQNHKKRIKDLVSLAQESRERIDALLGRKTKSNLQFDDDNLAPLPSRSDTGIDSDDRGSRRSSRDSTSSRQSDYDRDNDRSDSERRTSRTSEQVTVQRTGSDAGIGNISITMPSSSASNPPKVKPKPQKPAKMATTTSVDMSPKLIKKPFKFGMVSLQVKLDD